MGKDKFNIRRSFCHFQYWSKEIDRNNESR